jgi:hypothetical protein
MVKNVQVRLIIALMHSPRIIFLASSVQLPNNFYNDGRDRFIYRLFNRLSASPASAALNANDPTRAPRNQTLRLRLLHVETMIEIICTVMAAFIVLSYGISLNGIDPPAVADVLLNAAIQLVAECLQSLACNLFYVVVLRHPTLSVPLLRMQGFSLVLIVLTVVVWCNAASVSLPITLGHRAQSSASWVFLTDDFLKDQNASALCAAYPEAFGFADLFC